MYCETEERWLVCAGVEAMKRCFAWLRTESVEKNGNVRVLLIWLF